MIYGQRFYQVVSFVVLARLAPSVAIQLDKFFCMFDYNFKNNPPYKIWQENKISTRLLAQNKLYLDRNKLLSCSSPYFVRNMSTMKHIPL
jgi:hypothetical protein